MGKLLKNVLMAFLSVEQTNVRLITTKMDSWYFFFVSLGVKVLLHLKQSKQRPKSAVCVGNISRLVIFPVKSMKGSDVTEAICSQRGLKMSTHEVFDRFVELNFLCMSSSNVHIVSSLDSRNDIPHYTFQLIVLRSYAVDKMIAMIV